ncbi:alpha/beta hydrolase fold-domain-containing protein [Colletotrichum godetiae]|uniref:Alpha/beta hydrolase fold-domain-containing protein n=1 Tax=Colletotrichum godetiae TaxID=1209918 RepID=A0AAJ0EW10_9PEZI|nr:alpha/beta hydrolase fold-domain-containing protein [Colletotrichum godetiae]KAK1675878.1 alpha/beta hydrolase fold-domain-containing protein [Colletotrichum godetiae]
MVMGTACFGLAAVTATVNDVDAVISSVDYRLAPENHGSVLVEDCYAALLWVSGHSSKLGLDKKCLMVAGVSAGGGLAAGTALLARDRKGPAACAQLLLCPMLNDRLNTQHCNSRARAVSIQLGADTLGRVSPGEKTGTDSVSSLWESGIRADFNIWGGGCHIFDLFEAPTALGAMSSRTRGEWINKTVS